MNLRELDTELASWEEASRSLVTNVYELYDHSTFGLLAKDLESPSPRLAGVSREEARPAVTAVSDLLVLWRELDLVVKHATALRAALPARPQPAALAEIEALLTGPSIQLSPTQLPRCERGVLAQASQTRAYTPRTLLDIMQPAFAAAKSVILAIDEAWATLPMAFDALEQALRSIEQAAAGHGLSPEFDFADLRGRIAAARTRVMPDPLGVSACFREELEVQAQQAGQRLDDLLQERRRISEALAHAGALLQEMHGQHGRAQAAHAECTLKVEAREGAPLPSPVPAARLEQLAEWLGRLQAASARGAWRPTGVGFEKWRAAVQETISLDGQAQCAATQGLEARKELRGRLEALQAKAAGFGCAEDATLGQIGREAAALILRRPSPLPEIERLLAAYQKNLSGHRPGKAARRSDPQ